MKEKKVLKSESITTEVVPQHPYMAANNRSNVHCDAYMSDAYTCSGPLGLITSESQISISTQRYPLSHKDEICITITFDMKGRLITVGFWTDQETKQKMHELLLLDPQSLTTLASLELPSGGYGGGYFYLDQNDCAVIMLGDGTIALYEAQESTFVQRESYDPRLPQGSNALSIIPDWSGRIWVVTDDGYIAFVDPNNGDTGIYQLEDERIANSLAVDETGGVFVASDHAMYRFDYDASATGKISQTWRCGYDRGTRIKDGQFSQGTGTTPTLQNIEGKSYVAITDNADPKMNVLVYRREKNYAGDVSRLVGKVAVFQYMHSCTENSLIGVGSSFIVENNYGYMAKPGEDTTENTSPGIAKIVVGANESVYKEWENDTLSIPSLVSKASIPDGLIYTYSMSVNSDGVAVWYFTVLDFYTGKVVVTQPTGKGADYDNCYSGLALHPDTGYAYVPVCGGIVRIK